MYSMVAADLVVGRSAIYLSAAMMRNSISCNRGMPAERERFTLPPSGRTLSARQCSGRIGRVILSPGCRVHAERRPPAIRGPVHDDNHRAIQDERADCGAVPPDRRIAGPESAAPDPSSRAAGWSARAAGDDPARPGRGLMNEADGSTRVMYRSSACS